MFQGKPNTIAHLTSEAWPAPTSTIPTSPTVEAEILKHNDGDDEDDIHDDGDDEVDVVVDDE